MSRILSQGEFDHRLSYFEKQTGAAPELSASHFAQREKIERMKGLLERISELAHDGIHETAVVWHDGAMRCPTCKYPMPTHNKTCPFSYFVEIHDAVQAELSRED